MTLKGRKALEQDNQVLFQYVDNLKSSLQVLFDQMQPLMENNIDEAIEDLIKLRENYKKALDEQEKRDEEGVQGVAGYE